MRMIEIVKEVGAVLLISGSIVGTTIGAVVCLAGCTTGTIGESRGVSGESLVEICQYDPFCCDVEWDAECDGYYDPPVDWVPVWDYDGHRDGIDESEDPPEDSR